MPTRNVVITDRQSALLDRLVSEGRYQNASEVFRAGIRLLEEQEAALADFIARADRGLAEYEAGLGVDADEEMDRIFGSAREAAE